MAKNEKLKLMIEKIVNKELEKEKLAEQNVPKRRLAQNYAKAIKRKNPELHDLLLRQAIFAIKSVKSDEKPRDNTETIHKLFKLDPESDPRKSGDTHGVRLFIDALIEDPELAGKSKRWYQQLIDALLRNTYGQK